MAAPEFDTPMYEPLRDLGHDWLLPGAGRDPTRDGHRGAAQPVASSRRTWLGLSYEMGRELLFHEYPTDQRGTYFPQFWDVRGALTPSLVPADPAGLHDIRPIHSWQPDAGLGVNVGRTPPPPDHLVLLVKGELLRRFPDTLVSAVEAAVGPDGLRTLGSATLHPMFSGRLEPDIAFFGFDLSIGRARGGTNNLGWFFVLAEHPTEPRFGLDVDNGEFAGRPTAWADLNWAHLAASEQDAGGTGLCGPDRRAARCQRGRHHRGRPGRSPGTSTRRRPGRTDPTSPGSPFGVPSGSPFTAPTYCRR